MNKISLLALAFLMVINLNAQKTDTGIAKLTLPVPKSEFFNSIKKYQIVIQGSKKWAYTNEHSEDETYENTVTLNRYKQDSKIDAVNPDMKVIVGFTPSRPFQVLANGQTTMEGDFSYLILTKNDEIIVKNSYHKTCVQEKSATHEATMANTICKEVYEYLDKLLITKNENEFEFVYGFFQNTENLPELVSFNSKTDELIAKLKALSFEDSYLDETEAFYKSYIGKQFGKIKEKELNKLIYLNLSMIEIFKVNLDKSYEYFTEANKGAGFLSLWPSTVKRNIEQLQFVNQNTFTNKINDLNSKSAYYIMLKGTANYKKKSFVGKFYLPRFKPSSTGQGGIVSLDDYTPNVMIYEDGKLTYDYPNSKDFVFKTDSGKEICLRTLKGEYVLVEKFADGTYKLYDENSNSIYTSSDDKKLDLKS